MPTSGKQRLLSGVRCMMFYSTISTRVLFLLRRSLCLTTLAHLRSTLSRTFYRISTLQFIGKNRMRRKIRLTESNAKCRHLKKLTSKATLRQELSEPHTPVLAHTPIHTVYVTDHKAGSTIATFLTESPVYKLL